MLQSGIQRTFAVQENQRYKDQVTEVIMILSSLFSIFADVCLSEAGLCTALQVLPRLLFWTISFCGPNYVLLQHLKFFHNKGVNANSDIYITTKFFNLTSATSAKIHFCDIMS